MKQEDKERYFAAHWWQRVAYEKDCSAVKTCNPSYYYIEYLELTNLKDITDEHAIEVVKIMYPDCSQPERLIHSAKAILFEYCNSMFETDIKIIDFLRKHSYAVPFDGKSVEQLIEQGVLKLKEA